MLLLLWKFKPELWPGLYRSRVVGSITGSFVLLSFLVSYYKEFQHEAYEGGFKKELAELYLKEVGGMERGGRRGQGHCFYEGNHL